MSNTPIDVPLLDLKAQYETIREEIEAVIKPVLDTQYFVLGPNVAAFEEEIAAYLGADYAIGCASGGDALLLALMAFGIGHGDEVLCPSFTFFATAGTIARTGAKPIFVDVDPATYNIDIESLRKEAAKCKNLKAIMPVHLYGQSVDMEAVQQLADELGIPVIEDAAQAIGALDNSGNKIGAKSLIHCWSCYPTKNLGAFGDAGFVTTNDEQLAEKIRRLRVHGGKDRYRHDMIGLNSRLDAIHAAVLRVKLNHLDSWNDKRRNNAAFYDNALAQAGAFSSAALWSDGGLQVRYPHTQWGRDCHIYHQYIIRVPAELRDELRNYLSERKIGNEVFYPIPLHLQECFDYLGGKEGDHPVSEQVAKEVIALPIYPELTEEQLNHVATSIIEFAETRSPATAVSS